MHFVTRSNAEAAYNTQGYSLRQDPMNMFKQPPMHINRHSNHGTPTPHSREPSGGSIRLLNVTDELVGVPLLSEEINNVQPRIDHDCQLSGCARVVLNVAGQKFETQLKTLNRLPSTLLGDENKRKKFWDPKRKEYFFDRHRLSFAAILYYYQSGGRLKKPVEVPVDIFLEELQFYELGEGVIEAYKMSEGLMMEELKEKKNREEEKAGIRGAIWRTFEQPGSSVLATVVAIVSVVMILTSVCTYCIETLPQFKNSDCFNLTEVQEDGTVTNRLYPNFKHPLFIIETCCITWFVFELVIRAMASPVLCKFFKQLSNWIDFVSITPYFLFLFLFLVNDSCDTNSKFFSVLRVFRVARIFKLGRFSEGLQILGKTLRVSMKELSMFLLFLGIGVVIFAASIYLVEANSDIGFFVSIPDAFWWAVVSMTTVGYGDVYPVTLMGKFIGTLCVLCGLLAIALPVPVIVTNFNNIYRQTTGRGSSI